MRLQDRARQAGIEAERQYVLEEADRLEQTEQALRTTLAALALQAGGLLFVEQGALEMAVGMTIVTEHAEGGMLVRPIEGPEMPAYDRVGAAETLPPSVPTETLPEAAGTSYKPEEEPVEIIDETDLDAFRERRQARYLERHGQGSPASVKAVRPSRARAWDSPEDLAFQEEPGGRAVNLKPGDPDYEKRAEELARNDGSILTSR